MSAFDELDQAESKSAFDELDAAEVKSAPAPPPEKKPSFNRAAVTQSQWIQPTESC